MYIRYVCLSYKNGWIYSCYKTSNFFYLLMHERENASKHVGHKYDHE